VICAVTCLFMLTRRILENETLSSIFTMTPPSTAASITSLLNSLHTHLQSQTQLLPTLHAQLGLPPSALEDDLSSLQKELLSSVEFQVDKRRKEVEQWMQLCTEIENQCVRYTKALGGNIKATGSSIGELRKEQALPKRHDLIAEYQEKLRQVFCSCFKPACH
jgi:protein regulator of cytokinesis 1